jgi:phosphoribosylanthranilate isomerase
MPPTSPMRQVFAVASLILYDAKAPETLGSSLPGGNGHAFDWTLLDQDKRPAFMLAGGLTRKMSPKASASPVLP